MSKLSNKGAITKICLLKNRFCYEKKINQKLSSYAGNSAKRGERGQNNIFSQRCECVLPT